ncbi:helix-turn-helix domain-containing protein [Salinilacihabitans rarus]|uniref:helix-turn-helix domain-containing protein n=1 Tax=Salinilacihabitans rarus TaxID=2961596 RepID=UPI0020C90DD7|nr:helix-turn-helix domain-containing protein [Salinilacihabitans rarus]
MTTVAEIAVPAEEFALAETFEAIPDLEVQVKSVVAEGPLQTMPLVWIAGCDVERLEGRLEDDPTVEEFTRLLENPGEGEWLYRLQYGPAVTDRCGVVFDHDGTVLDAQGSARRWTLRLLFPDRKLLSSAVDELEGRGMHIDVKRMVEAGREADDLEATAALTDAQEEAITEAYRRGYYDVPRRISLEELAAELDISHQALSERLRRANKVLAGEQLDEPPSRVVDG